MTVQQAFQQLKTDLSALYDEREAGNIADLAMEKITGWQKMDRVMNRQSLLSSGQMELLSQYTAELLTHKPIQYVLEEAWFMGMRFFVNENVLIPRPETEELAALILDEKRSGDTRILDVGTGSGCLPIAMKKKLPQAEVYACDISEAALKIAATNAHHNTAAIHFIHCNFLLESERANLPQVDILISNPPYIPLKDKTAMRQNVLQFEPHIALFVPDEDPLIFYNAIADFAITHLSADGVVYTEIHENLAKQTSDLFSAKGFSRVEIKKDMQDKARFVVAGH